MNMEQKAPEIGKSIRAGEVATNYHECGEGEPVILIHGSGPGVTIENVLAATRGVSAALELVDSRIRDWRIKLVDTIADNASSARVIISERIVDPGEIDLGTESVTLLRNDGRVGAGTGAAVLNHPASAVAWLANRLADFGVALRAGQLILPGAMCAAVNVDAGATYRADFAHLGEAAIQFV